MNQLKKMFEGYQLTIINDNEPKFLLKDVCEILGLGQVAGVKRRLDKDVISTHPLQTAGGTQQSTFVSEDGLYDVILDSRKPEAKRFRKWITSEVVPSIRKHGAYMTPETIEKALLNPDTIINLATQLKDEQQKRLKAESTIEEQKPLVMFAETCMSSSDSILVREVAKLACDEGISIGEKRLYKKLRDWGLIIKGRTEPTQRGVDAGYFEVIQRAVQTPYGSKTHRTTKVTPKGQVYIIEKLKKELVLV